MKKVLFLSLFFVLSVGSGAWAALAPAGSPLPGHNGYSISVANNSNTFEVVFLGSPTQGMNAEWIGSDTVTDKLHYTSITTSDPCPTGSLTLKDTGGGNSLVNDFILLVSVAGPIANDFSLNLAWDKYDQTFTRSNFIYGPQTTRPGSNDTMALYPTQNINDPATAAYLMFVDMQVPIVAGSASLPVTYSFTGLYGDVAAFNVYGYSPTGGNVAPGHPGLGWTINPLYNGYFIVDTAQAPVPIPAAIWLFGSGLMGLLGLRRRAMA